MVVVDSRHGIKVSDRQMIQFLSKYNVRFQIVMNKTDSVTADDLARRGPRGPRSRAPPIPRAGSRWVWRLSRDADAAGSGRTPPIGAQEVGAHLAGDCAAERVHPDGPHGAAFVPTICSHAGWLAAGSRAMQNKRRDRKSVV